MNDKGFQSTSPSGRLPHNKCRYWGLCLIVFSSLLSACASYQEATQGIQTAWVAGRTAEAAHLAQKAAKNKDKSNDAVVFLLEEGAAWRAAGQYAESNKAFDKASERMAAQDAQAKIRLAENFMANWTNPGFLPYRGYAYDRVMLHTYKALNDLAQGHMDPARVELNRALQAQREAVQANANRIEAAQRAAQESAKSTNQSNYNAKQALRDRQFDQQVEATYRDLNSYTGYADYVNPFAVYLDGLYFMAQGSSLSDLERARKSFERVRDMLRKPSFIREDIALVDRALAGQTLEPTTYVLFETGMAPSREETRIDIPLFIVSNKISYFGVAFPKLKWNNNYIPNLTVEGGRQVLKTQLLCSMDSVVAQAFKNELPAIITRTLISAGTKVAVQYGLYQAAKNSQALRTLVTLAGTLYQAAMNQADLRTWITLPKQFQVARLPTPKSRHLRLRPQGGKETIELDLLPGLINVVYAKSNSQVAPPSITQWVFK